MIKQFLNLFYWKWSFLSGDYVHEKSGPQQIDNDNNNKDRNRKKYLCIELALAPPSPKYEKDTDKREFGDKTDMTTWKELIFVRMQ